MGKYFTMTELTNSRTATARGIKNIPNDEEKRNLEILIETLDKIREKYGEPISVTSGFRGFELNVAVGGVKKSQHRKGQAADITVNNVSGNKKLFDLIVSMCNNGEITFDQLIDEKKYTWIHISVTDNANRKQILHL